jgi:hypothetical protein
VICGRSGLLGFDPGLGACSCIGFGVTARLGIKRYLQALGGPAPGQCLNHQIQQLPPLAVVSEAIEVGLRSVISDVIGDVPTVMAAETAEIIEGIEGADGILLPQPRPKCLFVQNAKAADEPVVLVERSAGMLRVRLALDQELPPGPALYE